MNVVWLHETFRSAACPLCGNHAAQRAELAVVAPGDDRDGFTFLRCSACASLFCDPPGNRAYSAVTLPEGHLEHYLEVGAGIHAMLRRAFAVSGAHGRDFLDVGCGYGFAVDAWRRMMGGAAVGVELAEYGQVGAAELGIEVHCRPLAEIAALAGRRFGVVQAIEVIEHVADVDGFLGELAAKLSDDGVLVLTTPAADFIRPDCAPGEVVSLLSPGFHAFLFSRAALEAALRRHFPQVRVKIERETLSAWASQQPIVIDESAVDAAYLAYLEALWRDGKCFGSLHDGAAYRLFRERLNRADLAGAQEPLEALETSFRENYGGEVLDPDLAAALGEIRDIRAYRQLPWALAGYHYHRGVYARLAENDPVRAARHFAAAARIALAGGRVAPERFQEALSLVWIARRQEGLAYATLGNLDAARAAFRSVLAAHADGAALPVRPDAALAQAVAGHLADVGG